METQECCQEAGVRGAIVQPREGWASIMALVGMVYCRGEGASHHRTEESMGLWDWPTPWSHSVSGNGDGSEVLSPSCMD